MTVDRGPEGSDVEPIVPFILPPPVISEHSNMEPEFHPYGMDRMPHGHVIREDWDPKKKNRAGSHIERYHRRTF